MITASTARRPTPVHGIHRPRTPPTELLFAPRLPIVGAGQGAGSLYGKTCRQIFEATEVPFVESLNFAPAGRIGSPLPTSPAPVAVMPSCRAIHAKRQAVASFWILSLFRGKILPKFGRSSGLFVPCIIPCP